MAKKQLGNCPLCDRAYQYPVDHVRRNTKSTHHIFPTFWFGKRLKHCNVELCRECHDEFNLMFPMKDQYWSPLECVSYFSTFCATKGKDSFIVYPILKHLP